MQGFSLFDLAFMHCEHVQLLVVAQTYYYYYYNIPTKKISIVVCHVRLLGTRVHLYNLLALSFSAQKKNTHTRSFVISAFQIKPMLRCLYIETICSH